jgi:hypothetical protein
LNLLTAHEKMAIGRLIDEDFRKHSDKYAQDI